jgi:ligand-binding sensor domain-containing protein
MRRHLIGLFLLVLSGFLPAQQYNFRSYSVTDGLAQSQVFAMCEDDRGYLWLGTRGGGVSRFDGNQFRNYKTYDGLINDFVRTIETDAEGNVWIGTDEGACIFNGHTFSEVKMPGSPHTVRSIVCAGDGKIWIGTEDTGLFVLEKGKFTLYREYNPDIKSEFDILPSALVNGIFEDSDGSIWVGTSRGVMHFLKDGTTEKYDRDHGIPGTADIYSIARDGQGRLWFASYGSGLYQLKSKGKFTRFTQENGLANNTTHCMVVDKKGRLWVGTPGGVTRIDGENVITFTEQQGLCSNAVSSIIQDSWGNIWFGTSGGGVCRLDGERFIHFNEKSGDMGAWVYMVFCDTSNHMWFSTSNGGVTEYDGEYFTNYFEGAGFTSFKVRAMTQDTTGRMWFGTTGDGLYSFADRSFSHYTRSNGLSQSVVSCLFVDSLNRIWAGTAGGFISVLDQTSDRITRVGKDSGFADPKSSRVSCIKSDAQGNIWVGTNAGAYLMEYDSAHMHVKKHYTTSDGLAGNFIRSITTDQFGNLWFGAAGGVTCYDGTKFIKYTIENDFASDNVYSLIADKEGHLWVGTEKGVDRALYDASGKITSIKHYGKGEGFTGIEVSQNAACLDTGNGVWFGTINGASVYHPESDFINEAPPKIHITGIRLFFDPIEETEYGKNKDGYKWFPIPEELILPYEENHLRFEFTGIDLRNPEGVMFRWKLLGFETDWVPENFERQTTYSNLRPGDYTFQVQAKNSDGYWSDLQSFSFRITPPIYETLSFRLGIGGGILLLLIVVFRWRLKRAQRRSKELLSKVRLEKHVLELEQKALRLQMNPHFIFNALQSINGYIARNDAAEARKYLAKFGKLMRMTLENSRTQYTSIEQETELLYNYTALEAMSQGNRFTTNIEVDEKIKHESTFIPVMLIQPFVENAIIHGLKHKVEGGGELHIRFRLAGKENGENGDQLHIVCEIEDNGVGRKKAAEYEAGIKKDHKSAALEITRDRLKQMSEEGKPKSAMEIVDLMDSTGESIGTKVIIRIGNVVFE